VTRIDDVTRTRHRLTTFNASRYTSSWSVPHHRLRAVRVSHVRARRVVRRRVDRATKQRRSAQPRNDFAETATDERTSVAASSRRAAKRRREQQQDPTGARSRPAHMAMIGVSVAATGFRQRNASPFFPKSDVNVTRLSGQRRVASRRVASSVLLMATVT